MKHSIIYLITFLFLITAINISAQNKSTEKNKYVVNKNLFEGTSQKDLNISVNEQGSVVRQDVTSALVKTRESWNHFYTRKMREMHRLFLEYRTPR